MYSAITHSVFLFRAIAFINSTMSNDCMPIRLPEKIGLKYWLCLTYDLFWIGKMCYTVRNWDSKYDSTLFFIIIGNLFLTGIYR